MKLFVVLLVSAVLYPSEPARAQQCSGRIEYVLLDGKDTVAFDRSVTTKTSFAGEVRAVQQGAFIRYSGQLAADGHVLSTMNSAWPVMSDSLKKPDPSAVVKIWPDSIVAVVTTGDGKVQTQLDHVSPGTYPYMTNLVGYLQVFANAALREKGDSIHLKVAWTFTAPGRHDDLLITKKGKTALSIKFPEETFDIELAKDGTITKVSIGGIPTIVMLKCVGK